MQTFNLIGDGAMIHDVTLSCYDNYDDVVKYTDEVTEYQMTGKGTVIPLSERTRRKVNKTLSYLRVTAVPQS